MGKGRGGVGRAAAPGAGGLNFPDNVGVAVPRTRRQRVRVTGAGGISPTAVGAHQFSVGNDTLSFSPRPYNEARRLAIQGARQRGVDRIRYLGAAAFGGFQGRDRQFRGATPAIPAGRTRRR